MAAPPAAEKSDALAPCVTLTRLLACRNVGNQTRLLPPVDLTSRVVASTVRTELLPFTLHPCEYVHTKASLFNDSATNPYALNRGTNQVPCT